jgi:BirA family biotin operon repressor/biotin-[acetyl-CoA-carboxylase] ligase
MQNLVLFHAGLDGLAQPAGPEAFPGAARLAGGAWTEGRVGDIPCLIARVANPAGPVYLCGLAGSCLDVGHDLAGRNLLAPWSSVLAAGQTAGRGQLGRSWHSPPGNLYAAVSLPLVEPFSGTAAATALGAMLAAALRDLGCPVQLKWPNDLIVFAHGQARKAGGILLEERRGRLLAGIGLNIAHAPPRTALRENHALPAGRLPCRMSVPELWVRLVAGIKVCYEQKPRFAARWRELAEGLLFASGRMVGIVDGPDEAVRQRGVVSGLADDGALLLRVARNGSDSIRAIRSGCVILKEHMGGNDSPAGEFEGAELPQG